MDFRLCSIVEICIMTLIFTTGCSGIKSSTSSSTVQINTEDGYCSPVTTISGVNIVGNASYEQLQPTSSGLGNKTKKPIRYVEVRLLDASGNLVQCTETDNSGNYSLQLNAVSQPITYTLQVNSRANNSHVKVSVLDDYQLKHYYSVSTQVTLNPGVTNVTATSILALSTSTLEGGAFNILEQILLTNEFLKYNSTDVSCSLCVAFTVAPKVTIYWKKGFSPGTYSGNPSSGVSFYDWSGSIDSTPSLYILGGISGDVDYSDTDHYDNSVIIHEYGHFLEHTFARTDSPGGSHNGNSIIDPRLAWSEGYADFLPSAVTGSPYYIDTEGSPSGDTTASIYLNLETPDGHDSITDTTTIGEGVYREVSISRALYDYIDSNSDLVANPGGSPVAEHSQLPFAYIWAALTNPDHGLKNTNLHFRSMGHFNQCLKDILNLSYGVSSSAVTQFDVVRKGEYQTADTSSYAQELKTVSNSTCTKTITPVVDLSYISGSAIISKPNLFDSSKFYSYHHLGGSIHLSLNYTTDSTNPADLDLFLYNESYVLEDQSTIVGFSNNYRKNENPMGHESITLSNLAEGYYLIRIKAFTTASTAGGSSNFDLLIGDQYLCP